MPGINTEITGPQGRKVATAIRKLQRQFLNLEKSITDDKRALHSRYAIQGLNWVDRNFRQQGALTGTPWKKLSPNTILGRRKGSSVVLQDTGDLRRSFTSKVSNSDARVGTEKKYASYHEEGVNKRYPIRPKNKKRLAFPHASGTPLKKRTVFPSIERGFPKGTPIVYSKGVIHPGLPKRRMLPTRQEMLPILIRVTQTFLKQRGQGLIK